MKDYLDEYIVATRLIHRPQGATVYELAEALDKTTRAVYLIINQLETMNFPIWTDQDPDNPRKVRFHADSTFAQYLPSLDFSDSDKAVFNYLIDSSNNTPGMEIQARHLFTKLKLMASERGSLLENNSKKPLAIISPSSVVKKIDNRKAAKTISLIIDAISKKQWIDFDYYNIFTKHSYKFTVYPIVLFVNQGDYYLYAYNRNEQLRMLALERINGILSTYDGKQPKKQADIKTLLDDPFGIIYDTEPFRVKLIIDEDEALYVKQKKWPESVVIHEQKDGSILFETTTHSLYDCRAWILQHTPHIAVIEPKWLKDDLKETLQKGLALY